jgi:myo-inositol-1(or 4)-monophosphatase
MIQIPPFLSQYVQAPAQAALKAGELLRKGFGTDFLISPKDFKNDVVTEYDHASEELIVSYLQQQFPTHGFLCEERGHIPHSDDTIRWVIDPLDGTVNFSRGVPLFSISIAACLGEEVLAGILYAPMTDELFVAEKNHGAFLNGVPIHVSKTDQLDRAYGSTSLSFNLHRHPYRSLEIFTRIAHLDFPLRALGSTALNLAYVAAGRFDLYWSSSGSVCPWDLAAGKLLVEEAGGCITQCDGTPCSLYEESSLLGTNGLLQKSMIKLLTDD